MKYFILLSLLCWGCSTANSDWTPVSLEALPFSTEMPADWTVVDSAPHYRLWFDEGLTGSVSFLKEPVEGGSSDGGELVCTEEILAPASESFAGHRRVQCVVNLAGEAYQLTVTDKGLSAERRAEVEEILNRIQKD